MHPPETPLTVNLYGRLRACWALAALCAFLTMGSLAVPSASLAANAFPNSRIADIAESLNGTEQGQCIVFVANVLKQASGGTISLSAYASGYQGTYAANGGTQVAAAGAARGDIIQVTPAGSLDSQGQSLDARTPLHTMVIRQNLGQGQFAVVDANELNDDGVVREHNVNLATYQSENAVIKIWRMGQVASPPASGPSQWVGHIVQWNGDRKAQKTAWLVGPDMHRRWIASIAVYNCLRANGAQGPTALPAATLNQLPDLSGVRAACTPRSAAPAAPVAQPVAAAAPGLPVFGVMNTDSPPPDGVWFRNSPRLADTDRVTGHGVYMNEQVQLQCYGWGDAVGPYNDTLWYRVVNLTRPTNAGVANVGWLNAHYINDGKAANQVDGGVPAC
ncbi:MAG TPA: hypothetical protein VIJ51_00435 [Solirubrobacteraceae bacterium]